MIAKVTGGSSFRGVLDYLMQAKPVAREAVRNGQQSRDSVETKAQVRHQLLGGNLNGQAPRELAREFAAFQEQRPEITKPVHHVSLSAAKGEHLSDQQWRDIARRYVEQTGYVQSPYVVVRHLDTENDHIHLVASRIDTRGQVVSDFQSKWRAEEFAREIEQVLGLQRVAGSRDTTRAAPKRGEIEHFNRTGKLSVKIRLQSHIDLALVSNPGVNSFFANLQKVGVEVIPFHHPGGHITGISFRLNGQLMKGSNLGPGYSWPGLQKRGLSYEYDRQAPAQEKQSRALEATQIGNLKESKHLPGRASELTENLTTETSHLSLPRGNLAQRLREVAGLPLKQYSPAITALPISKAERDQPSLVASTLSPPELVQEISGNRALVPPVRQEHEIKIKAPTKGFGRNR